MPGGKKGKRDQTSRFQLGFALVCFCKTHRKNPLKKFAGTKKKKEKVGLRIKKKRALRSGWR